MAALHFLRQKDSSSKRVHLNFLDKEVNYSRESIYSGEGILIQEGWLF